MALEQNVNVTLVYGAEGAFGTAAAAGGTSQIMRRIQSSLNLGKQAVLSEEVRVDHEVATMRHGMRSVDGSVTGEIALGAWDDFMEAVLGGTWAAGASETGTDSVTTGANAITRGAGSWITQNFKIGDVVRFTGLSDAANNGKNLTITGLTAAVMTVAETLVVNAVGDTSWTCTVTGEKCKTGTTRRSFTIEQNYPTIDMTELYKGCRIGKMSLNVVPNSSVKVAFDVMGQDGEILSGASAPYFTAPTAAGTVEMADGNSGTIVFNGAGVAVATSVELSIDNGLSSTPVIGSDLTPDVFYGVRRVTGSVNLFLEGATVPNVFLNESEANLFVRLHTSASAPEDFVSVAISRLKLQGATKSVGADGGLIITCPFHALLRAGGAATAYDQTSVSIQKSA